LILHDIFAKGTILQIQMMGQKLIGKKVGLIDDEYEGEWVGYGFIFIMEWNGMGC
jgi:hypothetical protein